jgi:hypothetical protein
MKTRTCFLLLSSMVAGLTAFGDSRWSDVPASPGAMTLDTIEVAGAPTEAVVTLVGQGSPRIAASAAPLRVFGIDLAFPVEATMDEPAASRLDIRPAPEGAHWPDANGRIAVGEPPRIPSGEAKLRNPWELRGRPRSAVGEIQFLCGGIVAGGPAGPVGLLNGRIVKRGDSLGAFSVAGILAGGVLLERGGTYFVVPLGKRTLISTAGP